MNRSEPGVNGPDGSAYEFSGFRLDPVRRVLSGPDGQPIFLKAKAFETLLYLVEHAGGLCDKRDLLAAVWPGLVVEENNLNQNISAIRRALGERPGEHKFIVTEPGRGYRFVTAVHRGACEPGRLGGAHDGPSSEHRPVPAPPRERSWRTIAAAGALLALIVLALAAAPSLLKRAGTPGGVARFTFRVPDAIIGGLTAAPRLNLACSPDGSHIVFSAGKLQVRALDRLGLTQLATDDNPVDPFFSPDGRWVAYFEPVVRGALRKIRIDGGEPVTLVEHVPNSLFAFGAWRDDGTIVYSHEDMSLGVVSDESEPRPPIALSAGPSRPRIGPVAVAGSSGEVLFTSTSALKPGADLRIELFDPTSDTSFVVQEHAMLVALTQSHHVLFVQMPDRVLMAAPLDVERRRLGPALPVVETVARDGYGMLPQLGVTRSGMLCYLAPNRASATPELVWVERDGTFSHVTDLPRARDRTLHLAPDGRFVIVTGRKRDLANGVWVYDLERDVLSPLELDADAAQWDRTAAGRVLYAGPKEIGRFDLGSSSSTVLSAGIDDARGVAFTPDGSRLLYMAMRPDMNVYVRNVVSGDERELFASGAYEARPSPSPDGKWVAYEYGDDDGRQVRVARLADGGQQQTLKADGAATPVWRPDGKELFYVAYVPEAMHWEMRAVAVTEQPDAGLMLGPPESLFVVAGAGAPDSRPFAFGGDGASYAVSADGSRFLMVRAPPDVPTATPEVVVVMNWLKELESWVPRE